jgi:hypothetical protein
MAREYSAEAGRPVEASRPKERGQEPGPGAALFFQQQEPEPGPVEVLSFQRQERGRGRLHRGKPTRPGRVYPLASWLFRRLAGFLLLPGGMGTNSASAVRQTHQANPA